MEHQCLQSACQQAGKQAHVKPMDSPQHGSRIPLLQALLPRPVKDMNSLLVEDKAIKDFKVIEATVCTGMRSHHKPTQSGPVFMRGEHKRRSSSTCYKPVLSNPTLRSKECSLVFKNVSYFVSG